MIVYRIEHPDDNYGFFRSYCREKIKSKCWSHSNIDEMNERHNDTDKFPTYDYDLDLQKQLNYNTLQSYRFAFLSIEDLKTMFTSEELKESINDLGFQILKLEVSDYFESKFQVVYRNPIHTENISNQFI